MTFAFSLLFPSPFLSLSVSSSILGDKLYGAPNWFSVNCVYPSRVLIKDRRVLSRVFQRYSTGRASARGITLITIAILDVAGVNVIARVP